jgi:hypothetical protein
MEGAAMYEYHDTPEEKAQGCERCMTKALLFAKMR